MKNDVTKKHTIDELDIFIQRSINVKVESDVLITLLNHLTSQYFFNKSTYYVDSDLELIHRKSFTAIDFKESVKWYVMCIDLHNRIVVFKEDDFIKGCQNISYHITLDSENDIHLVDNMLNKIVAHKPVIMFFNQSEKKNYLAIFANTIELWLHDKTYHIERSIFDMMYAEGEDFNPTTTQNASVFIHTEVRHQLYADKDTFVTDLLHSDLGLICDTQDRLRQELSYIPMPIKK